MKKILILPTFAVLVCVLSFSIPEAHAVSYTATQSGDWNNPSTWGGSSPPITINSGDTVTIPAPLMITISSGTIISNSGTIIFSNGDLITNHGTIINKGTFTNFGFIDHFGNLTNSGTFHNLGPIQNHSGGSITNNPGANIFNQGGSITNNFGSTFTNDLGGSIVLSMGFMQNNGPFNNSGTINLTNGAGLDNGGAIIKNSGIITIDFFSSSRTFGGNITNSGTIINNNFLDLKGTLNNSGTITNNQHGQIVNRLGNTINNSGTINNNLGGVINNSGTIYNRCGGIINGPVSINPVITIDDCSPITTLSPDKDSFVQRLAVNSNEGINPILRVMDGTNRILISFNQTDITNAASGKILQDAKLRLFITNNGHNWGTLGRTIESHKLLEDWAEGNGWIMGNTIRGTGAGETWKCGVDANITNYKPDCSIQWDGGNFDPTVSSIIVVNNTSTGWIQFDATSDVQAFLSGTTTNHGWIIKKTDETTRGLVDFSSREAGSNQPQLVLTFSP